MTRDEWLAAFAREAGVERPDAQEVRDLLALAAGAAHASERTAAPIACWIAGRSGRSAHELLAAAERAGSRGASGSGEQRGADPGAQGADVRSVREAPG